MNWLYLALLTAFAFGAYNVSIKMSAGHIHEIAGAVVLQFVAMVLGSALLAWLKLGQGETLHYNMRGVGFAVLAGVCVGLAEILSFYVFGSGVTASKGVPIIVGGSVVFGVLLGVICLGESLGLREWGGIALVIAGIYLLGGKA